MQITFTIDGEADAVTIEAVVVAGWTGRDLAAGQHHIDELGALGITPPSQVPLYYRVSAALLTQSPRIEVLGTDTSGEVEPLLVRAGGKTYLGLASDHTDRGLEAHSVAASKQACAKPVAADVWDMEEIAGHLDDIELRCWITERGEERLYQEGTLAGLRPLADLMEGAGLADGMAMLCGTLAARGGVRPASSYRMEMVDPQRGKTISLSYDVTALPVVS